MVQLSINFNVDMDKKSEKVGTGAVPKTTNKTIQGRSDQRPSGVQGQGHSKVTTQSRAVVPRGRGTIAKMPQQSTMIVPKGSFSLYFSHFLCLFIHKFTSRCNTLRVRKIYTNKTISRFFPIQLPIVKVPTL